MPVVEIATFTASPALLANHDLAKGALDITAKSEGFTAAYSGLQVEDQKTAYLVIAWESLEAHKKAQASANYAEVQALLRPALASPLVMHHVDFTIGDYAIAFGAPVTHMIHSKLPPNADLEALTARNRTFGLTLAKAPGIRMPPCAGPTMEDPTVYWTAVGWESMEAYQALAAADEYKDISAQIKASLAEWSHGHVKFQKAA